jgi:hypothetical protein
MRSLHAILPRVEGEIGFVLTSRSQGHTPSAEVAEGNVPEFAQLAASVVVEHRTGNVADCGVV